MDDYLIFYPVLGVCVAIPVILFLPASWKSEAGLIATIALGVSTTRIAVAALPSPVEFSVYAGWIFKDVTFRIDALSAWFIFIINLTCLAGAWYGRHYMKRYAHQGNNLSLHWILFAWFHYSMILVVSLDHGLAFLIAWEIMSVSSFLLVIFEHSRFTTLKAGINYLVQAHIGVTFLTVGFIGVLVSRGAYDFQSAAMLMNQEDGFWLVAIFFAGFALKAGFLPLHTWLPHAHPAAPSHVSGIMSGVMVTIGIYGMLRIITLLEAHLLVAGIVLFLLSLVTACYGVLSAAIHRDYKRMLAFSTIENVGIIGMGMGVGVLGKYMGIPALSFLGFGAALLHALNHSLYKPLLFYASGNIYQLTNTRNMEQLGGLVRKLPFTSFFFLCGGLAISGLPPFNGFVSKFLLFAAMTEGVNVDGSELNILMITGITGLALVGGLSLLTFSKAFSVIFLGNARNRSRHQAPEYLNGGHWPLAIILFLMLILALSPAVTLSTMERVVALIDPAVRTGGVSMSLYDVLGDVGRASLLFVLLIGVVYAFRSWIGKQRAVEAGPTWGCGYPRPNVRMQYTGKSFSKSLAKLLPFFTGEEKKYTEIPPETIFPSVRSYQSSYPEFFEKNLINKLSNAVLNLMNQFRFIHNGRLQYYILYGLVFMLLLIAATCSDAM